MALVVEDGTGLEDSNSYATVEEFVEYFTDRGDAAAIAATEADITAGLILATDYIDKRFGARFIGEMAVTEANDFEYDQSLEYPRYDSPNAAWDYDDDTGTGVIPRTLKYACIEYANRARPSLTAPLAPDPAVDASGVAMVTTMQKAGPVEQRFATAAGSSNAATVNILRSYPAADMYLKDLLIPGGGRTYR
jgi:hypothetical protein